MQMTRTCIGVLALACVASGVRVLSTQERAQAFLHAQPDPDAAGMADLKASDPSAFAMVQALLTKQQLGLLDPKHPTASFETGKPHTEVKSFSQEAEEAGITKDTPITEAAEEEASPVERYAPVVSPGADYPQAATHHTFNPWSFHKDHNDDDLVASVMGGDASAPQEPASTGSLLSSASEVSNSVSAPRHRSAYTGGIPSMDWGNPMASTPQTEAEAKPEEPQAGLIAQQATVAATSESSAGATSEANAGAADIDSFLNNFQQPDLKPAHQEAVQAAAAPAHDNPYLDMMH